MTEGTGIKRYLFLTILVMIVLMCPGMVHGAGQSSTNYIIPSDVLSGGGEDISSASYELLSTLAQSSPIGTSSSSSYINSAGFWSVSDKLFIDSDSDGMPDSWEITHFGDLSHDGTADGDSDGLSDLQEYQNSTDPNDPDSDNDEMPDGWEVSYGLNPIVDDASEDLDGDGISNLDEYLAGTDPSLPADSDSDGMPDSWEITHFGDLSHDGTADGDSDGLSDLQEYQNSTDPNDPDSDNDEMPDGWEVSYGLNPIVDDASEDLDGDGISNLDEYLAGTDPSLPAGNHAPDQPILSSPANGATVSSTPTLETGSFSDPDIGDAHLKTEWQISTESSFSSLILHITSLSHLTSLTVPDLALLEGTTYYWRVRFYDNQSNASEWSDAFSFSTLTTTNDQNSNGIPDSQENNTVDLDNDGTLDIQQVDIKSLNTVVGGGQMGVSRRYDSTVTSIEFIDSIDPDTICACARPSSMPLGLFAMRLSVANPGDPAEVTIYFSEAAPGNAKWYIYDSINEWIDYSDHATFSSDRKSVILGLKDGGYGDADGVANGTIVDPSGFGAASWIEGFVYDSSTSQGITTAEVTICNMVLNTVLDGHYLSMILPGTYSICVSASGYESITSEVEVPEGDIVTLDFAMVAGTNGDDNGGGDSNGAGGGGGGGGGCFIATAAYGSPMELHVKVLREFRERFMLTNPMGKAFIDLYNTYSSPVADFIANHDTMRFMVRWSLMPIVGMSWMSINIGLTTTLALTLLLLVLIGASAVVVFRRMM